MTGTKSGRRFGIGVLVLGMITCFVSGCGKKADEPDRSIPAPAAVEEETAEETEAGAEDVIEETQTADTSDSEKEPDEADEAEGASGVWNNNAHFVRAGDKVYFRMPETLERHETALWGDYADITDISQDIMEYSISDSELTSLLSDGGSGIMGLGKDRLYFRDVEYNNDIACEKIASIDLTGEDPSYDEISLGDDLVGVTPDGRYTIGLTYSYSDDGVYTESINVYEQTKYLSTYDMEDFREIAGITEDHVFYCTSEHLMQLDITTGDTIDLGVLPEAEYGYGEVQQMETVDDKVYIGLGFYDGTGHFYSDGYYITAGIDEEDSLSYEHIDWDVNENTEEYVPFYLKDGKQISTFGIPGTAYTGYSDGSIGYYDDCGKPVEVAKGFETVYDDSYNCMIGVELAELAGDKIFLIRNTNIHVPEEDIGWRTAYMRIRAEYFMIDVSTKEMVCIADIKASDYDSYTLP